MEKSGVRTQAIYQRTSHEWVIWGQCVGSNYCAPRCVLKAIHFPKAFCALWIGIAERQRQLRLLLQQRACVNTAHHGASARKENQHEYLQLWSRDSSVGAKKAFKFYHVLWAFWEWHMLTHADNHINYTVLWLMQGGHLRNSCTCITQNPDIYGAIHSRLSHTCAQQVSRASFAK